MAFCVCKSRYATEGEGSEGKKTRHIATISTVMEKRANVHRFMYCMSFSLITFALFVCYALRCFFFLHRQNSMSDKDYLSKHLSKQ